MKKLIIEIEGTETDDLECALNEVLRLVNQGFTSGNDSNEDGNFNFSVKEA